MLTHFPRSDAHPRVKWSGPEIDICGTQASLRRGELEVMLAQAHETRTHCLDVSRRVEVQDDHIVEVGRHMFHTFDSLVDHLDGPPGRSVAAMA